MLCIARDFLVETVEIREGKCGVMQNYLTRREYVSKCLLSTGDREGRTLYTEGVEGAVGDNHYKRDVGKLLG